MLIKNMTLAIALPLFVVGSLAVAISCGDDGNEADDRFIGAECTVAADCDDDNDDTEPLDCLTEFSGGYCGDASCLGDVDCPDGAVCVESDTTNYCFLTCVDKVDCNNHRTGDNEANCSANQVIIDGTSTKVCVPPSSGL